MGLKTSLHTHGLAPRKKWGQHFLTDARILASVADAGAIDPQDTVLEIGPGLGHLTRVLAARAGQVIAVEIDPGLAGKLEADFATCANVRIARGDILQQDAHAWLAQAGCNAEIFKVVANLPYYITSAVLRHLLEAARKPRVIVITVQREVGARMTAQPPEMNLLAVSVQFFARARIVRKIPAGAFYPRPQVDSAVVRLDVFEQPPYPVQDPRRFFALVRAGFGMRRKQLRNSLANGLKVSLDAAQSALTRAHIDPTRRAETLSLAEWQTLERAFVYPSWQLLKNRRGEA